MKKIYFLFILLIFTVLSVKSQTKRVLFLGNSYTAVNDLPLTVANVAASMGDNLIYDSNTPGGCTFQLHSSDPLSIGKIAMGNWDFVVLQEQSQLPSFPISQVESEVFPYARALDSMINLSNPCTETVFYMTWGRKNGDATNCAAWPPVCTYEGMDSLLNLRYCMMADSNHAIVSPVGVVWHYIRQNYPLLDLYQSDESHPSVAGTYIAAVCFYTTFYRKDPTLISYNSTLSSTDANAIKTAVKLLVYNNLMNWHIGEYDPLANFTYTSIANQILFTNTSTNSTSFKWNFGDGSISTDANPTHIYNNPGSYQVELIAKNCNLQDTLIKVLNIISTGINENSDIQYSKWNVFPNPVNNMLYINSTTDLPDNLNCKIFDVLGHEVMSKTISKTNSYVDVSVLAEGVYFIHFLQANLELGKQKFIKSNQ